MVEFDKVAGQKCSEGKAEVSKVETKHARGTTWIV
jgi:hypothetical protein